MFAKIGNSKSKQKWRAHYLKDLRLGTKGICIAKSSRRIISVIADTERYLYGVQFHGLTENGTDEKCCITACSTPMDCKEVSQWRNASSSASITCGVRSDRIRSWSCSYVAKSILRFVLRFSIKHLYGVTNHLE